ncbi:acyltransferase [Streptomyces sp. NBC_00873]|uniref:acyltransferase family protein n=1 Tax=unclassified Streptomyces TaxID=2593676 RepID=UPI00386F8363|nr:acyltransferase [Streptomyces sp. NBC_00873]WTA45936.1 acyltransferase [Streptomyces sp. NBC_00842]
MPQPAIAEVGRGLKAAAQPVALEASRRATRLYVIDGLRLVAALLVAAHHYIGTARVSDPGNTIWGRPAGEIFPNLTPIAAYGWIGVEFFFVISGFVICMSSWGRRPREFFVSRVIRLYPSYWFAVVFTTVVLSAAPAVFQALKPTQVILNLSMLQQGVGVPHVDGVYWTLWSELRFYLIFLIVVATGLTYRKVVVFCCAWGAVSAFAAKSGIPLVVTLADPASAWFFIAGLALYLMHRFGQDLLLWGILGLSWVMSQHELLNRVRIERVSTWTGSLVLYTVFLLVMACISLGLTDRIRWKWLTTAGSLTYPFYLVHYAVGVTAIHYLHHRVDARLLVTGLIVGALVLSWLIHRFVERPLARFLKEGLSRAFSRLGPAPGR